MLKQTPICDFGWPAPTFELPDLDGSLHSLERVRGPNGSLIIFLSNHCPYVQAIIGRLVTDVLEFQALGIGVAAIMSNDYRAYPDDAPEPMRQFAHQHRFTFPYLLDESQSVARAYEAVCTPDFFGFDRDLGLQYRGRIDSSPMNPQPGDQRELRDAMQQIVETGRGPLIQTASMGCSIKWKT